MEFKDLKPDTKVTDLVTMTAALTVLVQVGAAVTPGVPSLVVAFVSSLFLATKSVGLCFWKKPVEWVLSACLILSSANGVTNMITNGQGEHARMSVVSVEAYSESDYEEPVQSVKEPRFTRW